MQTLQWEDAWERTIATKDKAYIEGLFEKVKNDESSSTFIREAYNHTGALLVTVLIHNRSNEELSLKNTPISYTNACKETFISSFTLPHSLPAKTSMPWTFIFQNEEDEHKEVVLELVCN